MGLLDYFPDYEQWAMQSGLMNQNIQPGMAGEFGSGLSSVPLSDNASFVAGPHGAVGWQQPSEFGQGSGLSKGMAGPLGSGYSDITMPTGAEAAPGITLDSLMGRLQSGASAFGSAMKMVSPQQGQRPPPPPGRPIFTGDPVKISPFGDEKKKRENLMMQLMMQQRSGAKGLLG